MSESDDTPADGSDPSPTASRRTLLIAAAVVVGVLVVIGIIVAATRPADAPPATIIDRTSSTTVPIPGVTAPAVPGSAPTPVGTIGTGLTATVPLSINTCIIQGSIATVKGIITNTLGHDAGFRITVELANPDTLQLASSGVDVTTNVLKPNEQSDWELNVTDLPPADHVTCRVVSITQT